MAAVSLFWDTNMAVMTSCENTQQPANRRRISGRRFSPSEKFSAGQTRAEKTGCSRRLEELYLRWFSTNHFQTWKFYSF